MSGSLGDPTGGPDTEGGPQSQLRPRRQVVLIGAVLLVLVLGVGFMAATARLFLWPPTDSPARADAVLALGGDTGQLRAQQGVALAEAGYAPVVVVSRGGYPPAPCPTARAPVRVICFRANPLNTRGEVEYAIRLARARNWTSIVMVTERDQATRARMLFRRCSTLPLVVVPVSAHGTDLLFNIAYEWASLAKAFVVHTSC